MFPLSQTKGKDHTKTDWTFALTKLSDPQTVITRGITFTGTGAQCPNTFDDIGLNKNYFHHHFS